MIDEKMQQFVSDVLNNMPSDWLRLTTHRLDIYNESLAKTEFLEELGKLYETNTISEDALGELPTAYDYIRLGHPLSSVLEWAIAKMHGLDPKNVISFSSKTIPIMAVLRKNLLTKKNTLITYKGDLPNAFSAETLKQVYGYQFELKNVSEVNDIEDFDGSIVFISQRENIAEIDNNNVVDFYVNTDPELGSVLIASGKNSSDYVSEIQHVRRRETIAMTPANCIPALNQLIGRRSETKQNEYEENKKIVLDEIRSITEAKSDALVGSSGLSMQYAIVMGLVHDALENHPGKAIKIIVPPNCYGGTNDQARRVAACSDHIEVMDLPVDGDHNMVQSIDMVLSEIAKEDAIPYIIAEIPTNPRVEVPDMVQLRDVLSQERNTSSGAKAIDPVFILDQTFCPNVHFLGDNELLSSVRTIAYVSGSKFPSGGLCTAGYCVANTKAAGLMNKIDLHLRLCDNEATVHQMEFLALQLPSMLQRIQDAYVNTRDFVNYIQANLPEAKINFVSEELADQGFTPSVFSLDLPTKGDSDEERETYKRELNLKLITMMINEIPNESKYCVSYGQLKGCYWTIPATSTQGTTKEGDKDYIVRVALSGNMDLKKHKQVFKDFVSGL